MMDNFYKRQTQAQVSVNEKENKIFKKSLVKGGIVCLGIIVIITALIG
jgi:hypothetical protein